MPSTSKRFPYFKFYPRDWLEGTRNMTLEQRGAYIDLICMMMEEEGHLRDDERSIAFQMHVSTRKWRSIREQLVECQKIHVEGGLIVQERCLKELNSLLTHRQSVSESATNRERTKREKPKLVSNNNDTDTTVVALRARVTTDSDSDKKEETPPTPLEGGGAEGSASRKAGVAVAVAAAGMIAAAPLAAEPAPPPRQMDMLEAVLAKSPATPAPEPRKRGNKIRLAANWTLPIEWREETRAKFGVTDFQVDRQAERFLRWWTSEDCKSPLKANWKATWLNWIDGAQARGMLGPAQPSTGPSQVAPGYRIINGVRRKVVMVEGKECYV